MLISEQGGDIDCDWRSGDPVPTDLRLALLVREVELESAGGGGARNPRCWKVFAL